MAENLDSNNEGPSDWKNEIFNHWIQKYPRLSKELLNRTHTLTKGSDSATGGLFPAEKVLVEDQNELMLAVNFEGVSEKVKQKALAVKEAINKIIKHEENSQGSAGWENALKANQVEELQNSLKNLSKESLDRHKSKISWLELFLSLNLEDFNQFEMVVQRLEFETKDWKSLLVEKKIVSEDKPKQPRKSKKPTKLTRKEKAEKKQKLENKYRESIREVFLETSWTLYGEFRKCQGNLLAGSKNERGKFKRLLQEKQENNIAEFVEFNLDFLLTLLSIAEKPQNEWEGIKTEPYFNQDDFIRVLSARKIPKVVGARTWEKIKPAFEFLEKKELSIPIQ